MLLDSQHTITWAPAFVLSVINTPPEFDLQIYWSNQIWHAISKALFTKDILMQIKPKWGNVKYPSFKITHFADFFPLLCLMPLPYFDGNIFIEKQNQRGLNRLCQIIKWKGKKLSIILIEFVSMWMWLVMGKRKKKWELKRERERQQVL